MKALAFANNDMAVAAWTFDGKLKDCLGFAIYRIDTKTGTETCLPAMATFPNQKATPGRTTASDPVQKFFWKDVYAQRGGTYKYKIVPMTGAPGQPLQPMPYGPLVTNPVHLTPSYGALSAYFNRGILATQATARQLHSAKGVGGMKDVLLKRIVNANDPLRKDLAGQMVEALTALSDEAETNGGECFCALYEFEDQELISHLAALKGRAHLVLSNMPGTVETGSGAAKKEEKTNDTYAAQRQQIKDAGADVIDRFMPSSHIGHNKFVVLENGSPQAVLFGSTNWTARALCAQTNNSVIARSPVLATAYKDYWSRLKADTKPTAGKTTTALQAPALRTADANGGTPHTVQIEDGSCTVDIWFSPNTKTSRPKTNAGVPPDLNEVFSLIAGARQAILFLAFQPGSPSIIQAIADAERAKPNLFIRGAVTDAGAANAFYVGIKGGQPPKKEPRPKGAPPLPQDYRVISTNYVKDAVGLWEAELNSAGHAVIHDKIVVIDPFSSDCVVVTGSHNLGYAASYNNDENMAIIHGHRALAEAYAAHCLDVYDHYAWRYWLTRKSGSDQAAWTFLDPTDGWQDSYFDASNRSKSAELNFWLSAEPHINALPTPADPATTMRRRPALQHATGGISPAIGPDSVAGKKKKKKTKKK